MTMKSKSKSAVLFLIGISSLVLGCMSEPTSIICVVIGIVFIGLSIILEF